MWFHAMVLLVVAMGCVGDALVPCEDGRACPVGTVCDLVHASCVTPEQITSCEGASAGMPCETSLISGVCVDGVCFEPRCGDAIVETGEVCDDGNLVSGDGCASDCRSSEDCGNAVVETTLGEVCDDGNLVSGDGCDSRCLVEELGWSERQCGEPTEMTSRNTVFDIARNRIVTFSYYEVFEWDGHEWSCSPLSTIVYDWGIAYDSDRQRVVILSREMNEVHEWDGVTLTTRATTGAKPINSNSFTYDPSNRRFIAYSTSSNATMYYLDAAAAVWTSVAVVGTSRPAGNLSIAFDATRGVLVGITETYPTITLWTFTPATARWTGVAQTIGSYYGVSIAYHPGLQQVVLFGGQGSTTYSASLFAWNGVSLTPLGGSNPPAPRVVAMLAYDPTTTAMIAAGGQDSIRAPLADVWRWDGASWTGATKVGLSPKSITGVAAFPSTGQVIALSGSETWAWDGTLWSKLATTGAPNHVGCGEFGVSCDILVAYDPSGDRLVAYSKQSPAKIWTFDGQSWSSVDVASGANLTAIAYDPDRGALVGLGPDGGRDMRNDPTSATYELTSTGWIALPISPIVVSRAFAGDESLPSLAYDRRNHALVMVADLPTVYELRVGTTAWQAIFELSETASYHPIEHAQRGSVMFVDGLGRDPTWERMDDVWRRTDPASVDGVIVADPARAQILTVLPPRGRMHALAFTSATPRETCADGIDVDGDGKAACDDDDCWWRCSPACPPLSSCP